MENSRYAPLRDHFATLDAEQTTLSFRDVEHILGRELPPSASGTHARQWWANTNTHSQGQAWLGAGWQVHRLDPAGRKVEFRRRWRAGRANGGKPVRTDLSEPHGDAHPSPAAGDIVIRRADLSGSVLRLLEELAEEHGGDLADAARDVLDRAALERRRQLLDWLAAHSPKVPGDSTELIREDRNAR